MGATKGYYSLIQYCPDLSRLEGANVGVVVFCPERSFVKARVTLGNDRIRRFFGSLDNDWAQINALKLAVERRFEVEACEIRTLDDFEQFVAKRANEIQITRPRPMKVLDPEKDLQQLFEQLVGGRTRRPIEEPARPVRRLLERSLHEGGVSNRVAKDLVVEVHALHRPIRVPFGFGNGRFNLIKPVDFQQTSEGGMIGQACRLAVEGRSLFKNPDPKLGDLQLVVVGGFSRRSGQHQDIVSDIFEENEVQLYPVSALGRLVEIIRNTAKPLPR